MSSVTPPKSVTPPPTAVSVIHNMLIKLDEADSTIINMLQKAINIGSTLPFGLNKYTEEVKVGLQVFTIIENAIKELEALTT